MIHNDLPDSLYQEYFELKTKYDRAKVELPFDPIRLAFTNPLFFDVPERGELVGHKVLVQAGVVTSIGDDEVRQTFIAQRVGEVAAHCHGRIVVVFEGLPCYIGWIPADQFRVLDDLDNPNSSNRH